MKEINGLDQNLKLMSYKRQYHKNEKIAINREKIYAKVTSHKGQSPKIYKEFNNKKTNTI